MLADWLEQPTMIEPIYLFPRGELNSFKRAPSASAVDDLSLVKAADRLGEGIVVAVVNGALLAQGGKTVGSPTSSG